MIKNLILISWLVFLISAGTILAGAVILLKTHQNIGVFIALAGFMGLALSGFLMAMAHDVLS